MTDLWILQKREPKKGANLRETKKPLCALSQPEDTTGIPEEKKSTHWMGEYQVKPCSNWKETMPGKTSAGETQNLQIQWWPEDLPQTVNEHVGIHMINQLPHSLLRL